MSNNHELLKLQAENGKLKAELRAAYEETGQLETALDGLLEENERLRERNHLICSGLQWTGDGYEWTGSEYDYRIKPEESVGLMSAERQSLRCEIAALKSQLAARDADVKALREWLQKKEHDCSKRCWFTICAAFRQVISQINELPTMKDVT